MMRKKTDSPEFGWKLYHERICKTFGRDGSTLQIPVNDDDFDTLNGFLVSLWKKFQMMVKLPDCSVRI